MHIGVINTGAVQAGNGAAIKTRFLLIGMPICPLGSYYCISEGADGDQGMDIPLHAKSVLLGYARWWLGVAAFLMIVFAVAGGRHGPGLGLLFPAVGTLFLWGLTVFKLGKLSPDEELRREILASFTGFGIDPKDLHVFDAHKIYKGLCEEWTAQTGLKTWRPSVRTARGSDACLLYAIATYKVASEFGKNQPDAALAAQAWNTLYAELSGAEPEALALGIAMAKLERVERKEPLEAAPAKRTERKRGRDRADRTEPMDDAPDRIETPRRKRRTPKAKVLSESSRGLEIQCPNCAKAMKVKHDLAGKKGRCSRCKGALRIPRTEALPV